MTKIYKENRLEIPPEKRTGGPTHMRLNKKKQALAAHIISGWRGNSSVMQEEIYTVLMRMPMKAVHSLFLKDLLFYHVRTEMFLDFDRPTMAVYFRESFRELPPEERIFIIAHELAHIYLGHEKAPGTSLQKVKEEIEANRIVAMWGFNLNKERTYQNKTGILYGTQADQDEVLELLKKKYEIDVQLLGIFQKHFGLQNEGNKEDTKA